MSNPNLPPGQTNTNTNVGGGAEIANVKVGANTPLKTLTASGSNSLVVTANGIEIVGTATNVALQLSWNFSTTTTAADPGTGNVRFNNATPASVTEIYISSTTADSVDATTFLDSLGNTSIMYFQQSDDSTKKLIADVSAEPTDNTGWFTVTVTVADSGTLPDDAANLLTVLEAVGGSLTASQIENVPAGSISATNVQGALNELDTEKAAKDGDSLTNTSVNSVTLDNGGAATDFLNKAGGYTAPTDAAAIHDNVAGEINAIASKATPVSADVIVIEDSADSFNKKKVAISALPGSVDSVFTRTGAVVAVAGDYTASEVTNVPAGTIAATTVQAAIDELDANVNGVTLSSSGSGSNSLREDGTYVEIPDATTASPDLISNAETLIPGVWWQDPDNLLDFYPKYRKAIDLGVLPSSATTATTAHGVTNQFDRSISVTGHAYDTVAGGATLPLPYNDPSARTNNVSILWLNNTNLRIETGTDRSLLTGHATVTYSKSTDTPVTEAETTGAVNGGFNVQEFNVTAQTIERKTIRTLALINAATIGAASTITLPTSPVEGDEVMVKDGDGGAGTDTVTISASPSSADGTLTLTANNQSRSFVYATTWRQTT